MVSVLLRRFRGTVFLDLIGHGWPPSSPDAANPPPNRERVHRYGMNCPASGRERSVDQLVAATMAVDSASAEPGMCWAAVRRLLNVSASPATSESIVANTVLV